MLKISGNVIYIASNSDLQEKKNKNYVSMYFMNPIAFLQIFQLKVQNSALPKHSVLSVPENHDNGHHFSLL